MAKHWRIHSCDPERTAALERAVRVPSVVAQLLICRGLHEPRAAELFLRSAFKDLRHFSELPGATAAAEHILAAIAAGRNIVIYGDYDVDGVTGTAILYQCLKLFGAQVRYYIPHRIDEGYGLHADALTTLRREGAELIVTVDCGIASVAESHLADELGLELIVTDHHEMADELPRAVALVHPRLPGAQPTFTGLSGAGVALKVAWAICQLASRDQPMDAKFRNFLVSAVGLAALGTVADVVPLVDDNRILVREGLCRIKQLPSPGLTELLRLTKLADKVQLECEDIGFQLAPRINAAGRLGQAQLAVELLTTASTERARELAEYIHKLNEDRQHLERSIYLAANKQATEEFDPASDAALVLADRGWHPGVIGIVAGRLAEKFHRPVVLIALDAAGVKPGIGSARSVPGFNLHGALVACREHLLAYGGHAAAAGLKIAEENVSIFRQALCEHAGCEIRPEHRIAELWIDAEVALCSLNEKTVEQLEQLAPYGHGNVRPLLCATGVTLAEPPKRMGPGEHHLSLVISQHQVRMRGVAFGKGDWADDLIKANAPLAIAFRPVINAFRGRRTVELHITDWKLAEQPALAVP